MKSFAMEPLPCRNKCLLCGYWWEETGYSSVNFACCWCQAVAETLHPGEVEALRRIDKIQMEFVVWHSNGREDPRNLPVEQPAQIMPDIPLFIGDIDDAMDVGNLERLGVKAVVNLATEQMSNTYYGSLAGILADADIDLLGLSAQDDGVFDIVSVVEKALSFIDCCLSEQKRGVLVTCYGGVNRSGAVAAAYLVCKQAIPLCAAIGHLRRGRGTVLTNQNFVKQLVRYCWRNGMPLA